MALATLSIDLEARLAKLDEGMTRATRIVEKSGAQMNAAFAKASKAASAFIGLLGGASLGAYAASVIRGVDALNDFADATGTTVENASALEDIALRTGTSFEAAEGSLLRFNQALADAAKKDSDAARVFEQLGLNADELRRLDPAEALLRTAQALEGFAADGDRARAVQELFGKSVREVAPFLKDLAEAGQLNATVTTEQAAAAETYAKRTAELQKNVIDLTRTAVGPFLEASAAMAAALKGADVDFEALSGTAQALAVPMQALVVLGANVAFVFRGVGTEIGVLAAQAQVLATQGLSAALALGSAAREEAARARKEFDEFERRVLGLSANRTDSAQKRIEDRGFTPALKGVGSIGDRVKDKALEDALKRIESTDDKKIARIRAELEKLISIRRAGGQVPEQAFALLAEDLAKLDPAAREAAEALKRFDEASGKAAEMARKADEAAGKAADGLAEGNDALREEIELIGKSVDERARLLQARIDSAIASKEEELAVLRTADASKAQTAAIEREIELLKQRRSLIGQRAAAEKVNEQLPETVKATSEATDAARQLGLTFSSAFEDAVVNGERFSDVLKGIERDILRLILRKAVTEPFVNWFGGSFGGSAGSSTKDSAGINYEGGGGFNWGAIVNFFAGMFADGGYIPPGQWGIVGERGPELAYGGRTGKTIAPTGGGRSNTFVFNAAPGGSRRSQQQQAEDFFRMGAIAAGRNG